jgi:hypothetical protein
MVPVLNSMGITAAVYGNHDFGESSLKINYYQLSGRGWLVNKKIWKVWVQGDHRNELV